MPTIETPLTTPLVEGMIHRPDEPAHMMRIKPAHREVIVRFGPREIARSRRAMLVLEIGRDAYDPTYYVPLPDTSGLVATDRTTHCPLKGDTTYYDLAAGDGREGAEGIAWSYSRPLEWAIELRGLVAFDPRRVGVETAPL